MTASDTHARRSDATLRSMTADDIPALVSLIADLHEWFHKGVLEEVRLDCARYAGLVAEKSGTIAGFLLWLLENDVCHIKWLAVAREWHRQGIGSRLIDKLMHMAREAGARRISVATLAPTHDYEPYAKTRAFYEAGGFTLETVETKGFSEEALDKATYVLQLA